tara:strand:- start:292 stop:507 length:216 start_codon:yes stop_codon:yes gene_type:complete
MYQSKIAWARTQLNSKFGDKSGGIRALLVVIRDLEAEISKLKADAKAKKSKPAAKKPAPKKPAAKKSKAKK